MAKLEAAHRRVAKAAAHLAAGRYVKAEEALRAALRIAPTHIDALHMLGQLQAQVGELEAAEKLLKRCVRAAPDFLGAQNSLANVQAMRGDLEGATATFEGLIEAAPEEASLHANLALVLRRRGEIERSAGLLERAHELAPDDLETAVRLGLTWRQLRRHEDATALFEQLLATAPEDDGLKARLAREYFLWFDQVDENPQEARAVLASWLKISPDDPIADHMSAAHGLRDAPARASDHYIEHHFDAFAETFDHVLETIGYRGPALVAESLRAVHPKPRAELTAIDLGCGTGMSGLALAPWTKHLVGVDLSSEMLKRAGEKGCYDALVQAEIGAHLEDGSEPVDLIAVVDTLPYVGDVGALFEAAAARLKPGGLLIATAESRDGDEPPGWFLGVEGRYAHTRAYLEAAARTAGFDDVACDPHDAVRRQNEREVAGFTLRAQKPAA